MLFSLPFIFIAAPVDFAKEIQPLLESKCLHCHGPKKEKSGFRVDDAARMLAGGDLGKPGVVPGKPADSVLFRAISGKEKDLEMPPDDDLTPAEIALFERWISEGAPGLDRGKSAGKPLPWSFHPVRAPKAESIDSLVRAALAAKGLSPSPRADAATLARRVSILLTGLPPTAEDLRAPFEQLMDRLLASPHFGERWAQHWLDVIRWAETDGSEGNFFRKNAWIYRDYLIDAFNQDKPYDRFLVEQLAGDTMGVDAATGYLVAGPHVAAATVGREPSAIKQARYDRLDEVVQTVGVSALGMTIGCARCHNHKFDPILATDYYGMAAVFQDVEFGIRAPAGGSDEVRELAGQLEGLRGKLAAFGSWEEDWGDHKETHFAPVEARSVRVRFGTDKVSLDEVEIYGPKAPGFNLARGGAASSFERKHDGPERQPVSYLIDGRQEIFWGWTAVAEKDGSGQPWVKIDLRAPAAVSSVALSTNRYAVLGTDYLTQKTAYGFGRHTVEAQRPDGSWVVVAEPAVSRPERDRLLSRVAELVGVYKMRVPQSSFIGRFVEPEETHVLRRGNPMDPGDRVQPRGLLALGGDLGLSADATGPQRRLAFARWLTGRQNPLVARVQVNRIWMHLFGTGIVATPGDFGSVGAEPTNRALLDWLATSFVENGWSTKKLLRQILMSRTFQQSSAPSKKALAADAGSQLLWRFPPRRVEAEVIRDSMLSMAGTLDARVGGPSFRIFGVKKSYEQWNLVDNAGPATWRRMLYQERMRRVDDRMFSVFDVPDCGQTAPRRTSSTTPLQALSLMNGPLVVTQSQKLAQRIKDVDGAFQMVLGRKPAPDERRAAAAMARTDGLAAVARVLFNTNEFLFLN